MAIIEGRGVRRRRVHRSFEPCRGDAGVAVGSRIVAEVLVGLLLADRNSYLNLDPHWAPEPPIARARGELSMADIVRFTKSFGPAGDR